MPRPFKVGAVTLAVTALLLGAVGMTIAFQPGPAYLAVQSYTASAQGPNAVKLSASTNADIPKMTDAFIAAQLIVGIAWADLDSGTADDIDASVGFTVHTGDAGCVTGLGVRVRT